MNRTDAFSFFPKPQGFLGVLCGSAAFFVSNLAAVSGSICQKGDAQLGLPHLQGEIWQVSLKIILSERRRRENLSFRSGPGSTNWKPGYLNAQRKFPATLSAPP